MSTPIGFSVNPLDSGELVAKLQETTPEPSFRSEPSSRSEFNEQAYDWLCEIQHGNFTCDEIDLFRMRISDIAYWNCEAEHLKTMCIERIRNNLYDPRTSFDSDSAEALRSRCQTLKRFLKEMGVDSPSFLRHRKIITDSRYWQSEAEILRQQSAAREAELEGQFLANLGASGVTTKSEYVSNILKGVQGRQPRPRRPRQTVEPRRSDRLASKVGKRHGRVGGKIRNRTRQCNDATTACTLDGAVSSVFR